MRTVATIMTVIAVASCSSSDSGGTPPTGAWGSSQGSLTLADTSARLLIANGSCYGGYADISGRIPAGQFALSGTLTQLIGAAPGSVQYPATYTGTASASQITVTITLPSLGQQLAPISVSYGVVKTLMPCLFP